MTSTVGSCNRGFTLLELIVVVTILGIMLGVMTPLFRHSYEGLKVRNAYKNLAATIKHAQERAIMEGREFKLNLNEREGTYWLSYRQYPAVFPPEFVYLRTDAGRVRSLPEGVRFSHVDAKRDTKSRAKYITFYPNGAADNAKIRLRDSRHGYFLIETGNKESSIISFKEKSRYR